MPGPITPEEEQRRRAMHAQGWSDWKIARECGLARAAIVGNWRHRRGLPANLLPGENMTKKPEQVRITAEVRALCTKLLRRNVGARLIATEMGIARKTLERWRTEMLAAEPNLRRPVVSPRRRPRHPNGRPYSRMLPDRRKRAFELYAEGLSDEEIARAMGLSRQQIWEWRNAYFLKPNMAPGWGDYIRQRRPAAPKRNKRPVGPAITPRSNPLYAMIAEAVGRGIAPDLADDAISDIWIAIEEGQIDVATLAKEARRYRGKVLGTYASAHTRSLDETIAGTEDFRLIDTLVDDRSSSWLEEMGATVW